MQFSKHIQLYQQPREKPVNTSRTTTSRHGATSLTAAAIAAAALIVGLGGAPQANAAPTHPKPAPVHPVTNGFSVTTGFSAGINKPPPPLFILGQRNHNLPVIPFGAGPPHSISDMY
jgi:hypothetical protein